MIWPYLCYLHPCYLKKSSHSIPNDCHIHNYLHFFFSVFRLYMSFYVWKGAHYGKCFDYCYVKIIILCGSVKCLFLDCFTWTSENDTCKSCKLFWKPLWRISLPWCQYSLAQNWPLGHFPMAVKVIRYHPIPFRQNKIESIFKC